MNKKTVTLTESDLKNIIKKSVNNILKESFNDKTISNAIKDHGGIKRNYTRWNATITADYDLQNSEYEGYLSPRTLKELDECGLTYYIQKYLLYTNDGCAIAVKPSYQSKDSWDEKVRKRNQKWGENSSNKEDFEDGGYREEIYAVPRDFNTHERRIERKINI